MMEAIYNEIEPYACDWLENLIEAGHIEPGIVDRRSIEEIQPDDIRNARQFHTFAGIGVWSYALKLAGWPANQPVWTGSCPCQPFSAAGKQLGEEDDRHLWPTWFELIRECRPPFVFGEQVSSAPGLDWFGSVSADLERAGYAVTGADLPAASVGAPHRRQRLFFFAMADSDQIRRGSSGGIHRSRWSRDESARESETGILAIPDGQRVCHSGQGSADRKKRSRSEETREWGPRSDPGERHGDVRAEIVAHSDPGRLERSETIDSENGELDFERRSDSHRRGDFHQSPMADSDFQRSQRRGERRNMANQRVSWPAGMDHWRSVEWLRCSDGKARPTQPGIRPLADGSPSRVGQLRAYGNAIVPQVAAVFIRAAIEAIEEMRG